MSTETGHGAQTGLDTSSTVALRPLTFLEEGAEVTVGCREIDSYAVLPADGAALLRRLAQGATVGEGAEWYRRAYGETVDMSDFIDTLTELGFVRESGAQTEVDDSPVRWSRLGRVVFSPASGLILAALLVLATVEMLRVPGLAPRYTDIFFSNSVSLDGMVMAFSQLPLLLLHESAHALAGRRLGLRSKLTIGRRLYYVVFLTSLNGLVSVERRKRYLPMLAGMIADIAVVTVLILAADAAREHGQLTMLSRLLIGVAYFTLLRVCWQFLFFLETDLYYIATTVLGCVDLQTTARRVAYNRLARLFGRRTPRYDESAFHPRDRQVARWYAWLIVFGYTACISLLLMAVFPMATMLDRVFGRFAHPSRASAGGLVDSGVFVLFLLAQLAVIVWPVVRARRAAPAARTASP